MSAVVLSRFLLACLVVLAACAKAPPASDPESLAEFRELNDPLEPTNRTFYAINDGIDAYVLRPVAVAYRNTVPGAVRRPVHNLLTNMGAPAAFANDVLQGRGHDDAVPDQQHGRRGRAVRRGVGLGLPGP